MNEWREKIPYINIQLSGINFSRLGPTEKVIIATHKVIDGVISKKKVILDAMEIKPTIAPGVNIDLKKLIGEQGKED